MPGMIGEGGLHAHRADVEAHLLEFLDADVGRHFAQADGEERAFHLAGQHDFQAVARAFVAEDAQVVLRLIDGAERTAGPGCGPNGCGSAAGSARAAACRIRRSMAVPAGAGPVPASRMMIWPSARTSTQEVLPPYWTVVGPGRGNGAAHAPELHPRRLRNGTRLRDSASGGAARLIFNACGGIHGTMWRTLPRSIAHLRQKLKLKS